MIEAIHIDQIKEHGGQFGIRDENLLEATLARPLHRWNYEPKSDLPILAAAYGFALAKNHSFVDGNKRVAFMAMYTFLGLNGYENVAPEPEIVNIMLGVASGSISEEELANWLHKHTIPWSTST